MFELRVQTKKEDQVMWESHVVDKNKLLHLIKTSFANKYI